LAEVGIRYMPVGAASLAFPTDELWHTTRGRAVFRRDGGDTIDATPGTAIHFKEGWTGTADVSDALGASYMRCAGSASAPGAATPVLRDALTAGPLADWGLVSTIIEGSSRTAGIRMSREPGPERRSESGVWTCTSGTWICGVSRDEFCHFIAGRATYTHSSGDIIEIEPDTLACFPAGWIGVCEVHETVRKVFMIR
jgi:uncharacterized protein